MTALAAYWALKERAQRPYAAAERILRGQQIYGLDPSLTIQLGPVALGRRLFSTVPEDIHDHGPITGGDGRWMLTADVRLDTRDELGDTLGISAKESETLCDAALVMRAIERWQEDAFAKLIGDFAIILWDAHDARLLLARDFLGNRPLHYHHNPGFLAVASMPKGLHALGEVPREPDETAAAEFLGMLP